MLMIGSPFAWRDASGIAWTLAENTQAAVREEQRPVVSVGDEEVLDGVLLAGDVADDALAAAVLAAIRRDRLALDVAAPG
jgi:hypothetical protein